MPGLSLRASKLVHAGDPRGVRPIIDLDELVAQAGQVTILSGPSGSGKSTLLYLLSGLLVARGSSVRWGATELAALSETRRDSWRRANAGFVFQNFNLIAEMSPLDNVLVTGWFSQLSTRSLRQRAMTLLDRLDVPQDRKSVALLSRGEQQRVAIARALLHDPAVIFADEPTASLDAASGALVGTALKRLAEEQGRAVIVASHDPAIIALADQTIALDHGRMVPA